jgi:hypothetical protein
LAKISQTGICGWELFALSGRREVAGHAGGLNKATWVESLEK